ncbi:MAG: cytochrome c [Fluviicola sp.]|nr:cytochrome c [Fluviicola sp.]
MKKIIIITSVIAVLVGSFLTVSSCKVSPMVAMKSGAQIWGENCIRCHNGVSPDAFSDAEWEVTGMHMRLRANLTQEETNKVIEFLQSAN